MSAKGSELKRVRQSNKANLTNRAYKSKINTVIKRILNEKNKNKAQVILKDAIKLIDKVASKGIIHENKAANKKSTLYKYINTL